MPFTDNNVATGLPAKDQFQVGRADVDQVALGAIESGVLLPWASDAAASWVYYECAVGAMLDSGIVVHNRLPQVDRLPDTLASTTLDDPNLDSITGFGVNLRCLDQYRDITQRMGHSRYWFRLWGQAIRLGYQVPIPGMKTIGGVPAIPYDKNPQWAYNSIAPGGNYSGVIVWRAQWSLWYTTTVPPVNNNFPAADPAAHISSLTPKPKGMQAPYSPKDDNVQAKQPPPTRSQTQTSNLNFSPKGR